MQRRSKNHVVWQETQPRDETWTFMIRHSNRSFSPPTDVIELDDRMLVIVEIAGVRSSELNITLWERHLVISGRRERPQHTNAAYHQVEIGYGEFQIDLALPWAVKRDEVSATYEAGFLQIELPRKAARAIPIVTAAGDT
jgi:HSP20 family protein